MIVVGILLLVALVGVVAWVAGGGDDDVVQSVERADERFPDPATTVAATSSVPLDPAGTVPVTLPATVPTTPPPTLPATSPAPTTAPVGSDVSVTTVAPDPTSPTGPGAAIGELVPFVAAVAEPLTTPEAVQGQIDQLLAAPRHDVASEAGVSALCAVVLLDAPISVEGRWERDGHRVLTSSMAARRAPGYGECVGDDGDPLDGGSYQYIATDADGDESAAGGFVVGAARVDQRFVNNGDTPICAIRIAPSTSRYFEAYVLDSPVTPKSEVTLPVADVRQDVETTACDDGTVVASFDFHPDPAKTQELDP